MTADLKRVDNFPGKRVPNEYAVAIGSFDGFHLGHRKIIDTLKTVASAKGLATSLVTFNPNPKQYFNKDLLLINTEEQKKHMLEYLDIDSAFFLNFADVLDMPGEDFVKKILVDTFNMKYVVMGENFKFGKNRTGGIDALADMGRTYDFGIQVVKPVVLDGDRISSSLIRQKLGDGEIAEANRMLARPYFIDGLVCEGRKVGRKLGFPTINVDSQNRILPGGVFESRVETEDGSVYDSITNIGFRPACFIARMVAI